VFEDARVSFLVGVRAGVLSGGVFVPTTDDEVIVAKADYWISEVDTLSSIATTQPHADYTCFTHGLFSRWLYLLYTVLNTSSSFQPLERTLLTKFIPGLTGLDPPAALQRSLFAFQQCLVVWVLLHLMLYHRLSLYVTAPLRSLVLSQNYSYTADIRRSLYTRKLEIKQTKSKNLSTISTELLPKLTLSLQKASTRKGCFKLAHCSTCCGSWVFFTQDYISGCPCFKVWLDALLCTFPLYMWHQLFC